LTSGATSVLYVIPSRQACAASRDEGREEEEGCAHRGLQERWGLEETRRAAGICNQKVRCRRIVSTQRATAAWARTINATR
jgi:hypothetical protein